MITPDYQDTPVSLRHALKRALDLIQQGNPTKFEIFLDQETHGQHSWQMDVVRSVLMDSRITVGQYEAMLQSYAALQTCSQPAPTEVDLYDCFQPGKPLPTAT